MSELINKAVLVLNYAYEPISICSVKRALTLITKDKASIIEGYGKEVYPGIELPCVIRLKNYKFIPIRLKNLTRDNIYVRDHYTCQYCIEKFARKDLTLDHIIPESRGGAYSWHNIVTACKRCNRKKADKTPEEAGMVLLHKPRPMNIHTSRSLLRLIGLSEDTRWHQYLYA
jgi:5-methylcytosine-specific restriction endonuclease McrA